MLVNQCLDKLRHAFYRATGGRPMRLIDDRFIDIVSGDKVGLYQDKFCRLWLASGRCDLFRVRVQR